MFSFNMHTCQSLLIFIMISFQVNFSTGAKILSVFLLCGRSSMNYFDPIHLALANKGHQITVITPTPSLVRHENIVEYPGVDFATLFRGMTGGYPDYFQMRLNGEKMAQPFATLHHKFAQDCDKFHQLPAVQQLISGKLGKFDLVMTMAFMNECVYGIFHRLNASSVLISTVPTMPWFASSIGAPTPLSLVPHIYFPAVTEMSFWERVQNVVTLVYQVATRNWIFNPAIEKVYQKYIPEAGSVLEVENNVSLILGAGHPTFGPLRPEMPGLVDDIGGIHCRPAKPLPENMHKMILDENENEMPFIYFSLGSIVQSHQVPDKLRNAIMKTFAKFSTFRILWKWEGKIEEIEVPENVRVNKWFPQQDLLGHNKCKLFITHGGLSSLHETIFHAVPVIGIPFFGDQDWNMKHVEEKSIGRKLELKEINENTLSEVMADLLNNSKYQENIFRLSELFRDRQVSALDKAVWSIEYVLRHGGAVHLRSPARNMNTLQYYCVDVILALLAIFISIFVVVKQALKLVVAKSQAKRVDMHSKSKKFQ